MFERSEGLWQQPSVRSDLYDNGLVLDNRAASDKLIAALTSQQPDW
jgi:hypothetical protein